MNSSPPVRAAVIGAGNLAWSLVPNLQQVGVEVVQLISRSVESLVRFSAAYDIPVTSARPQDLIRNLDWVFITVTDHAIPLIVMGLSQVVSPKTIYLHTSGSISLSSLEPLGENIGVFYPMQTFTRGHIMDFSEIPVFTEGNTEIIEGINVLARSVSGQVASLNSEDRLRLHLGAVLVNNFTNYLYQLAEDLNHHLSFDIYHPLIKGHLKKVFALGPAHSQTGPAARGDRVTVQKHLDILADRPEIQQLYLNLTKFINPGLEI